MKALLNTHAWIGWLLPDSGLTRRERAALDTAAAAGDSLLSVGTDFRLTDIPPAR